MSFKNILVDLDDSIYVAAHKRAQTEGRTLESVVVELLTVYSGGEPEKVLTTYTVKRGDTLARIAREMFGDATKYPLIQKANNLTDPGRIWVGQVLVIPASEKAKAQKATPKLAPAPPTTPSTPTPITPSTPAPPAPTPITTSQATRPTISALPSTPAPTPVAPSTPQPSTPKIDPCAPISGETYGTLPIVGPPTDRPAAEHGDINLALRGYEPTNSTRSLIDMSGPTDSRAPQLAGLFADYRTPEISNVYRAHHWDWGSNSRGGLVSDFEVTVAGFAVKPGEVIHVPSAGYQIGSGYAALVLYADKERITLKYTGEDSVVSGYTLHIDGICTEPNLLSLYQRMNSAGRRQLPALRPSQAFGRAIGSEIQIAVRDTGRFMDPRVRKDWWRGR